ncbi:hypothetical protein [Vibrio sp. LaRot3]|uniref:hypothetical protein n=1 Tax=Vibrio sp. LaRot3 TaxID=2998829 RepID=UPI0022CDC0F2|nr:hypothetical protein [Vibrio sp. LaRot3]MDA0147105.1 hypothetical protein [Vibrio sp. LaRot3]
MAEYETDDPANPAVDSCFNDLVTAFELGDASECDFKQYIATSLCLGMLVNAPEIGSVKQCLTDSKYYPSIVNDGGI